MNGPPLLTAGDVAARLQVCRSQAYAVMKAMDHVTVGDRGIRVTEEALKDYLRRNTSHPVQAR